MYGSTLIPKIPFRCAQCLGRLWLEFYLHCRQSLNPQQCCSQLPSIYLNVLALHLLFDQVIWPRPQIFLVAYCIHLQTLQYPTFPPFSSISLLSFFKLCITDEYLIYSNYICFKSIGLDLKSCIPKRALDLFLYKHCPITNYFWDLEHFLVAM